ncbi:MAG: hypothetical protein RH942_03810 [Kiloniellaceae bacterium]
MLLGATPLGLPRDSAVAIRRHAMIHRETGNFKAGKEAQEMADRIEREIVKLNDFTEHPSTSTAQSLNSHIADDDY